MAVKKKITKKKAAYKKVKKKKTGRKLIPIPWKKVERLLQHHCTGTQVAASLNIHPETLYNRCKEKFNVGFSEYSRQKKDSGVSLLKDMQFKTAKKGNHIMQIFLGKNYADQRDKPEPESSSQKGTIMKTLDSLMQMKEDKTN